MYDDWMDKYAYLIEIGNGLNAMDETHKTDDNLIKGCQSRVWFHAELRDDKLYFEADSDAIIHERYCRVIDPGILRSDASRHREC